MPDPGTRNSGEQFVEHIPEGVLTVVKRSLPMGLEYDEPGQRLSRQHAPAVQRPHGLSGGVPFTVDGETETIELERSAARKGGPRQREFEAPSFYPALQGHCRAALAAAAHPGTLLDEPET